MEEVEGESTRDGCIILVGEPLELCELAGMEGAAATQREPGSLDSNGWLKDRHPADGRVPVAFTHVTQPAQAQL